MYSHILTSVVGKHRNNQDAIKYFESTDKVIAIVADGLGSRKKSAVGARLICRMMVEELETKQLPLQSIDIVSPIKWYEHLEKEKLNPDDYCTTCSFAVIDKISKIISVGQIGDSPIFVGIDGSSIVVLKQEKEFSNITTCLGGREKSSFTINNFKFNCNMRVLVTSDGIGDELDGSNIESLFSYLSSKYQPYSKKSRSRRFTKEIKATVGKVNNDDKSAIYIWSL